MMLIDVFRHHFYGVVSFFLSGLVTRSGREPLNVDVFRCPGMHVFYHGI